MKTRMIASALLIMLLSIGISSKADASPWRHGYGYCHPIVRVCAPRVVIGGGYYGGGYCAPAPGYYGGYYAAGPRYYGGGYDRGYYGHGYSHGYYCHGGYRGRR